MRNALLYCFLIVMLTASGCIMRTYTVEMDRVDQEIKGNRGVVFGTPPEISDTDEARKTRTIYNVEIELPSGYRTAQEIEDKELYGNRGYVTGKMSPEKEVCITEGGEEKMRSSRFGAGLRSSRIPQIVYSESSANASIDAAGLAQKEYYVVQKGDTLQKISKKFFGTTRKWKKIYNANKNVLKSPDRIRSGQKLAIPK